MRSCGCWNAGRGTRRPRPSSSCASSEPSSPRRQREGQRALNGGVQSGIPWGQQALPPAVPPVGLRRVVGWLGVSLQTNTTLPGRVPNPSALHGAAASVWGWGNLPPWLSGLFFFPFCFKLKARKQVCCLSLCGRWEMQRNKAAPAPLSAGAVRSGGVPLQGSQAVTPRCTHPGSNHPSCMQSSHHPAAIMGTTAPPGPHSCDWGSKTHNWQP